MSASIKRFFSRQRLMQVLGWCGVRAFLWRMYCHWFGPGGGILSLDLGERHARFYVHTQWVFADLKSFGGERDLLALLCSELEPGDAVYDVGANMGLYTVFLGQVVAERGLVVAFEPETHYCERLRANVALNGLHNVRIVPVALGDRSYTAGLLSSERGMAAPRVPEARSERAGAGSFLQRVRVVPGDELVEKQHLRLPRLVKIDVEGSEHAVIRGLAHTLSNPVCRLACCELHPKLLPEGLSPDDILTLLKACGFTRFDIRPRPPEQHVFAFKDSGERRGQ